jgi:Skp family chaperone for outer membrane proteins
MKLLKTFCLVILFFSTPISAEEKGKGKYFQEAKAAATSNLDKRIQHLQETKSCVSGSSDHKALKACRAAARKKGESLKAEMREKREKAKAERMKRKEERKKNKS